MNPRPQVVASTRRPSAVDLELTINADLPQFEGHFAEAQIVAGVVQIDWAISFARDHFPQLPPRFAGMTALKFMRVIQPGDRPLPQPERRRRRLALPLLGCQRRFFQRLHCLRRCLKPGSSCRSTATNGPSPAWSRRSSRWACAAGWSTTAAGRNRPPCSMIWLLTKPTGCACCACR